MLGGKGIWYQGHMYNSCGKGNNNQKGGRGGLKISKFDQVKYSIVQLLYPVDHLSLNKTKKTLKSFQTCLNMGNFGVIDPVILHLSERHERFLFLEGSKRKRGKK